MRLVAALIFASACNVEGYPACNSRCGLTLMGPHPEELSCKTFQLIEDAAIVAWQLFLKDEFKRSDDFKSACSQLSVYRVFAHNEEFIPYPGSGGRVSAYTDCFTREIRLGNRQPPLKGALAHEMAHAVTNCATWCRQDDSEYNPDGEGALASFHCGWNNWGLFAAEQWVHSLEDI